MEPLCAADFLLAKVIFAAYGILHPTACHVGAHSLDAVDPLIIGKVIGGVVAVEDEVFSIEYPPSGSGLLIADNLDCMV